MEEAEHDRTGQYQAALDACLALAATSTGARARVRDSMLHSLSQALTDLSDLSTSTSSQPPTPSPGTLEWEGPLSEIAKGVYSLYADNAVAMTMLGVKCLEEGLCEQAKFFLGTALATEPEYLVAREKLRVLSEQVVNRWHFQMLNDVQRNSAYSRAIQLALQTCTPHCNVLDIGSGTGILRWACGCSGWWYVVMGMSCIQVGM